MSSNLEKNAELLMLAHTIESANLTIHCIEFINSHAAQLFVIPSFIAFFTNSPEIMSQYAAYISFIFLFESTSNVYKTQSLHQRK